MIAVRAIGSRAGLRPVRATRARLARVLPCYAHTPLTRAGGAAPAARRASGPVVGPAGRPGPTAPRTPGAP